MFSTITMTNTTNVKHSGVGNTFATNFDNIPEMNRSGIAPNVSAFLAISVRTEENRHRITLQFELNKVN